MTQLCKKRVYIEHNAKKELNDLDTAVRNQILALIKELKVFGTLEYPESRKISGYNLYELRVRFDGSYRCIYSYIREGIVILSVFRKKTQKTPLREIQKALKRRNNLF